jgi:hypothetical protein
MTVGCRTSMSLTSASKAGSAMLARLLLPKIRYFAIRNFYKTIDVTAMGDEGLCDVNRLD